jgi:hypothetical protein
MTVEQIEREQFGAITDSNEAVVNVLREIAVQLAELNERERLRDMARLGSE